MGTLSSSGHRPGIQLFDRRIQRTFYKGGEHKMITEEREMIVQAVLAGELAADYLTMEEVEAVELLAFDTAMEQQLADAMIRGKAVFWGLDGDPLQ
jgi:hypothetical protein